MVALLPPQPMTAPEHARELSAALAVAQRERVEARRRIWKASQGAVVPLPVYAPLRDDLLRWRAIEAQLAAELTVVQAEIAAAVGEAVSDAAA